MEGLIIRAATAADLDILRQFEQGVIQAERPFDETLGDDPLRYYNLEEMIRAPHIELKVAALHGEVVGSGYARIEQGLPFVNYGRHAYLGFMYVLPQHRGKGINQAIVEALRLWSVSQSITEMRLEVYLGNGPAIQAYEKVGFQKLLITMRRGTADR